MGPLYGYMAYLLTMSVSSGSQIGSGSETLICDIISLSQFLDNKDSGRPSIMLVLLAFHVAYSGGAPQLGIFNSL
jgi:hypothetical protein